MIEQLLEAGAAPDEQMDRVLSLRADERWSEMIDFIEGLPSTRRSEQPMQRQLALALNRLGRSKEAEAILVPLVNAKVADSKTLGILGRVYRDRWENTQQHDAEAALADFRRAIEMYSRGFDQSERKNIYPGINLLTLLVILDPADPRIPGLGVEIDKLVAAKVSQSSPDYFDYATQLELAIDLRRKEEAQLALKSAKDAARAKPKARCWALRTTAHNLQLLRKARAARNESFGWANEIEGELLAEADRLSASGTR